MKKLLPALGALALLGWTALGLFAWSRVSDGVELTLAESGGGTPDGVALLEDQVDTLDADLRALAAALEVNFGQLADAVREGASAQELALLEQRLGALEAALPHALAARESAAALASALTRVEALGLAASESSRPALAAPSARAPGTTPEAAPPAESTTAAEVPPPAVTAEVERSDADGPAPDAPAPEEPAPEEPAPGRSFLAFQLPSRDFRFAGRQDFDVLESLSRVGFDAKSTLHDFTGVSNAVGGRLSVDLARSADGIAGYVEVRSDSLSTGLEGRDEAMAEHLETERFAVLRFEPTAFAPATVDPDALQLTGRLTGRMTIHGVEHEVAVDVRAHVDESRRLVIEGELPLRLGDYGVSVPDKLGVISVNEELRAWFHLRLRARVGESRP